MNFTTQFSSLIDNYVHKELGNEYHNDEFKDYFSEWIHVFVLKFFAEIKHQVRTTDKVKCEYIKFYPIDDPAIKLIDEFFNKLYEIRFSSTGTGGMFPDDENTPQKLPGHRGLTTKQKLKWTWKESNPYLYGKIPHYGKITYYEPDYRNVVSTDWNMAQKGERTDLTIIVEEKKIPAHSQILSCRSEYFKALLRSQMNEAMTGEIEIKNHKSAVIENYIKFIYTQELDPKVRESAQLLVDSMLFAHQNQELNLIQACVSELLHLLRENEVEFDTFKSFIDIALEYEIGSLLDACFNYIMHHEDILDWLIKVANIDNWEILHQRAELSKFTKITEELETIRKYNQSFQYKRRKVSK